MPKKVKNNKILGRASVSITIRNANALKLLKDGMDQLKIVRKQNPDNKNLEDAIQYLCAGLDKLELVS